jgi:hypothetical protein
MYGNWGTPLRIYVTLLGEVCGNAAKLRNVVWDAVWDVNVPNRKLDFSALVILKLCMCFGVVFLLAPVSNPCGQAFLCSMGVSRGCAPVCKHPSMFAKSDFFGILTLGHLNTYCQQGRLAALLPNLLASMTPNKHSRNLAVK